MALCIRNYSEVYKIACNIYYILCSIHYRIGAVLGLFCHDQIRLEDFVGEIADFHDETAGPKPDKARSLRCSAVRR